MSVNTGFTFPRHRIKAYRMPDPFLGNPHFRQALAVISRLLLDVKDIHPLIVPVSAQLIQMLIAHVSVFIRQTDFPVRF